MLPICPMTSTVTLHLKPWWIVSSYEAAYWMERISYNFLIWHFPSMVLVLKPCSAGPKAPYMHFLLRNPIHVILFHPILDRGHVNKIARIISLPVSTKHSDVFLFSTKPFVINLSFLDEINDLLYCFYFFVISIDLLCFLLLFFLFAGHSN